MTQNIGRSIPRVDAHAKVTGVAKYPGDLAMDGMLHACLLFAGRPHARILSLDTSRAEACPGVVAIFTARDVPVNERGLQIKDQPVLCGPGSAMPGADIDIVATTELDHNFFFLSQSPTSWSCSLPLV